MQRLDPECPCLFYEASRLSIDDPRQDAGDWKEIFQKAAERSKVAATIAVGGSDNVGLLLPMAKQCLPFGSGWWTDDGDMDVGIRQVVLNEGAIARAKGWAETWASDGDALERSKVPGRNRPGDL